MKWRVIFAQTNDVGNPEDPQDQTVQSVEERKVFLVPEERLQWLDAKLQQLNKIARKLGLQPVGYNVLREEIKNKPGDQTGLQKIVYKEIELFGESPIISTASGDHWKFIARLMHSTDGNIIKAVPGEELPPQFRTSPPTCQHCNYNRNRRDTFVLKNPDDGRLVQVGSNCLKDFLGHRSVAAYASWAEILADLDIALSENDDMDMGGGGGGGSAALDIVGFVTSVYAVMKANGLRFISKAKAREHETASTTDITLNYIYTRNREAKEEFAQILRNLTPEDRELVQSALDWARSLKDAPEAQVNQLPDYYWNLSLACSSPVVKKRTEGIVGSLMAAYQNAVLGRVQAGGSGAVGEKGQEVALDITIDNEKAYGDTTVYRGRTSDNKLVQWSGDTTTFSQGQQIKIQGVIIGFTKIYAELATRLARVKVLSEEEFAQQQQTGPQQDLGPAPEYIEGNKISVDVTVLSIREMESQGFGYGRGPRMTKLYKMIDAWGNTLSWFSSGEDIGLEEGEKANISATVKKINTFRGQEEVQVTRVKVNSRALPEGEGDPRLNSTQTKEIKKRIKEIEAEFKTLCFGYDGSEDRYNRVGPQFGSSAGNFHHDMEKAIQAVFPNTFYQSSSGTRYASEFFKSDNPASVIDEMLASAAEQIQSRRQYNWEEDAFSKRYYNLEYAQREVNAYEKFVHDWPGILNEINQKLTAPQSPTGSSRSNPSSLAGDLEYKLPSEIKNFVFPDSGGYRLNLYRWLDVLLGNVPKEQWTAVLDQKVQEAIVAWKGKVDQKMQQTMEKMREEHQTARSGITTLESEVQQIQMNKSQYVAKIQELVATTPFRKIINAEPRRAELSQEYMQLSDKLSESAQAIKLYGPLAEEPRAPRGRGRRNAMTMGIKWLKKAAGEALEIF